MTRYLFRNVQLLDPAKDELLGSHEVLVEGKLIREVSDRPIKTAGATVIDGGGRTLMPGLIDCHVHVYLSEVNIRNLEHIPLTLMTARAAPLMRGMIDRGFTTVRDTGGADWGIKAAVEGGLLPGPRLFISGRAIGPTGGHSDSRRRTDGGSSCGCCNAMVFCMSLADGADEVRRSAREQMRQGADQVKIMMSGGVASPYDPLDSLQYSPSEVAAVVEAGYRSLEICQRAEVPVAYGSDLLGPLQEEQSREFLIRGEVMKPVEVIRSATTVAARVLRREGTLGVIAPGALADLLVVDGNPLLDLGLFQKQGAHLTAIMKGGA